MYPRTVFNTFSKMNLFQKFMNLWFLLLFFNSIVFQPLKKAGDNEESYNVRYSARQYDSKISELEKKSTGKDKKK